MFYLTRDQIVGKVPVGMVAFRNQTVIVTVSAKVPPSLPPLGTVIQPWDGCCRPWQSKLVNHGEIQPFFERSAQETPPSHRPQ